VRSRAYRKIADKARVAAATCLLLLHILALGQTKPSSNPVPPEVSLQLQAHPTTATVGDPVRIEMDIAMPEGYQVEVPRPAAENGDFRILDFSSGLIPAPSGAEQAPKSAPAKPIVRHRTRIAIAVYRTGKFSFPAIPVTIKTAEGTEIAAQSPTVEIEIRSVLTEKDPVLKDLKKQAELKEPVRWLLWAGLIAACAVFAALLRHYRRRKRKAPLPLTPAQTQSLLDRAETDLRRLLARGLPGSGEEKAFYVALSEIVKKILEGAYGIHTAEQTTSEIMESLQDRTEPDTEGRRLIEDFLSRCDIVKFARYAPTTAEHEAASQSALQILAEARKSAGRRQAAADGTMRVPEK